ncbi:MAG: hypothetical protein ACLFQX_04395 [Candidatus Kapaibacterium sp.]
MAIMLVQWEDREITLLAGQQVMVEKLGTQRFMIQAGLHRKLKILHFHMQDYV